MMRLALLLEGAHSKKTNSEKPRTFLIIDDVLGLVLEIIALGTN